MFDLTVNEISDLHQEALRRSASTYQSLRQAGLGYAPLGRDPRTIPGKLLIHAGQSLKQHTQPDPTPALIITL